MNGGKKVVHLTSFHTPGDTRLFHRELKTLVRAGWPKLRFAYHDSEEIGPKALSLLSKKSGLKREDL